MRVLFGMILGIILTIGVAFVHDTWTIGPQATAPSTTGMSQPQMPTARVAPRAMVNWDVVGQNLRLASQRMREAWTALSHKVMS